MNFDILHNFISPVTGYILANPNYVPYGNRRGIAIPSPILIDIRLDLINLRKSFNTLSTADFVIGHPNLQLPNAQVLNELDNGFIYNDNGEVSTFPSVAQLPLCYAASVANLPYSYENGDTGIGATLTATSLGIFILDDVMPPLNSNVLIKDQTTTYQNGIYVITIVGDDISIYTVLTRSPVYDLPPQIQSGNIVPVEYGTINTHTLWVQTQDVMTIGTDAILFVPFTFFSTLPLNNIWIGNDSNQPVPSPIIFINNLPNLTSDYIWRGNIFNRPIESDGLTKAEKNISTLLNDYSKLLTDLANLASIISSLANTVSALQGLVTALDNTVYGTGVALGLLGAVLLIEGELSVAEGSINRLIASLGPYYQGFSIYPPPISLPLTIFNIQEALAALTVTVANLRLSGIPAGGDVNLGGFRIINLNTPINPYDGANKIYVDQLSVVGTVGEINVLTQYVSDTGPHRFVLTLVDTGVIPGSYSYPYITVDEFGRLTTISDGNITITLTGPVTGSGSLGSPISTTFNLNLNDISTMNLTTGNVDLNYFKIINLANPTDPMDAVNLQTLESYIPIEYTINLIGDVLGSGPSNVPIVTTMVRTLNNLTNAGNVDIKNFSIINVGDPTNLQDAVNLRTLNYYFGNLKLNGFVVGGPAIQGTIITIPGPSCLLTNILAGGNVDFGGFRLTNLADSTEQYDGVNFNTLWDYINSPDFTSPYIVPELKILGPLQQFKFDINYSGFQLENRYIPTPFIDSQMRLEFQNSNYSGFRIRHNTTNSQTTGNFYIERYINAEYEGDAFFGIDESLEETVFYKDASMDHNSLHDVAELEGIITNINQNDAISFTFLYKLLNDEIL